MTTGNPRNTPLPQKHAKVRSSAAFCFPIFCSSRKRRTSWRGKYYKDMFRTHFSQWVVFSCFKKKASLQSKKTFSFLSTRLLNSELFDPSPWWRSWLNWDDHSKTTRGNLRFGMQVTFVPPQVTTWQVESRGWMDGLPCLPCKPTTYSILWGCNL